MKIYIVFAHPSHDSFTYGVLEKFTGGLTDAGHTFDICDLYEMDFQTDMDLDQYKRETGPYPDAPVPNDVRIEQERIDEADAVVFIYPVWWSDCPAKLKGWFDRVLSFGYAYYYEDGVHLNSKINIKKTLVLCTAGTSVADLEKNGIARSMKTIMIDDRIAVFGSTDNHMEILGGMTPGSDEIKKRNLEKAYHLGKNF
jgi:NAD(P)H dehydrogenase (quinone)